MKLLFTGDLITEDTLLQPDNTFLKAPGTFTQEMKDLFSTHTIKTGNLEGSFSDRRERALKAGPNLLLNKATFSKISGFFNVLSGANNHSMDYLEEGYDTTKETLEKCDISYRGVGKNQEEAFKPFESEKFVIFCVSENEFGFFNKDKCGIASTENLSIFYNELKKFIGKKIVIIYAHGGAEIIPLPPPYLKDFYRFLIDIGCNIIINNHPHVVQGYEIYKKGYIFYSLGNFIWDISKFKGYKNSDWSLLVSCDILSKSEFNISFSYSSVINNEVSLVKDTRYGNELAFLSSLIESPDYESLYDSIVRILHKVWYGRFFQGRDPNSTAELLHYIRCNTHKSNTHRALSLYLNEVISKPLETFKLNHRGHDYIDIEKEN